MSFVRYLYDIVALSIRTCFNPQSIIIIIIEQVSNDNELNIISYFHT